MCDGYSKKNEIARDQKSRKKRERERGRESMHVRRYPVREWREIGRQKMDLEEGDEI